MLCHCHNPQVVTGRKAEIIIALVSLENEGKVVQIELNHSSKMLSKCTEVIKQSLETQRHLFIKFITA
jgi:uncharacterized protein YuzE